MVVEGRDNSGSRKQIRNNDTCRQIDWQMESRVDSGMATPSPGREPKRGVFAEDIVLQN